MRTATRSLSALVLAASLIVSACDSNDGVAVPEAEVLTISLTLLQTELTANRSFQIVANISNERGEVHAVPLAWESDTPGVASVDRSGTLWTHRAGTARISAALDGVDDHTAEPAMLTVRVLDEVAFIEIVAPSPATLRRGETLKLEARPRSGDGSVLDHEVFWTSSDPGVATVGPDGTVTGLSAGLVLVSAEAATRIASLTLTVLEPVATVAITPVEQLLGLGQVAQLTATLQCEAGTTLVNRVVTWATDAPSVAVVTDDGHIVGVGEGAAEITATSEGVSGTAHVTVKAEVGSIEVTPNTATIAPGRMLTLSASVLDADGVALVRAVSWASSDTAVAQVQAGTVLGRRDGVATITATAEGIVGRADITVLDPNVTIRLPAGPLVLEEGDSVELEVVVTDSEGRAVERLVTWSIDDDEVATIVDGVLRGHKRGTTVLEARVGDHVARVEVEVVPPGVARIAVSPGSATLSVGETLTLKAVAFDKNGAPLRRTILWRSADEDVARVDASGVASGVGGGSTEILAVWGSVTGTAKIEVLAGVTSIEIVGPRWMTPGERRAFQAVLHGKDGEPVTSVVRWSTEDTRVAVVNGQGMVSARGEGRTVLTASSEGVSATFDLVVSGAGSVDHIAITRTADEEDAPVRVGTTEQLIAIAYSVDGVEVPGVQFMWTSSSLAVASVDGAGLVTGISMGTVTITASARSQSASIELRVVGSGSGDGGGGEEGLGNNLSTPLIFAEGVGVTGLPVDTDTGLRPTESEGIDVTVNPFWFDDNQPDCGDAGDFYYCQQGENTWRAEWLAAIAGEGRSAAVQWGDNLTHHAFNTHTPLRIEVRLYDRNATMQGFSMPYSVGSGPDEMQGTDGTLLDLQPTIFAVTPRLVIQKLENYDEATGEGDVVATVYDAAIWQTLGDDGPGRFGAEVNVGGTLIYGYLLFIRDVVLPADVHKYGWWRLIVRLDDQATLGGVSYLRNVSLDDLVVADESEDGEALLFTPRLDSAASTTWLDIWVESASGGGGGGGDHTDGGTGEHSGG